MVRFARALAWGPGIPRAYPWFESTAWNGHAQEFEEYSSAIRSSSSKLPNLEVYQPSEAMVAVFFPLGVHHIRNRMQVSMYGQLAKATV